MNAITKSLALAFLATAMTAGNASAIDLYNQDPTVTVVAQDHSPTEERARLAKLEVEKKKLLEIIARSIAIGERAKDETEFIEEYAKGKMTLQTIVAENPLLTGGSYVAALTVLRKVVDTRINTAVAKIDKGLVDTLLSRYPTLSKSTNWVMYVASTAYGVYYTIDRTMMLMRVEGMTSRELQEYYELKLLEIQTHHDIVVDAVRRLLDVKAELAEYDVQPHQPYYMR